VRKEFQRLGIGRELINLTRERISEKSMLLLLSVPEAMEYYPKAGFEKVENGFIIKRQK
jgi:predicted N-acetyltransferase YhbS